MGTPWNRNAVDRRDCGFRIFMFPPEYDSRLVRLSPCSQILTYPRRADSDFAHTARGSGAVQAKTAFVMMPSSSIRKSFALDRHPLTLARSQSRFQGGSEQVPIRAELVEARSDVCSARFQRADGRSYEGGIRSWGRSVRRRRARDKWKAARRVGWRESK